MVPESDSISVRDEADYRYTIELSPQVPWTADATGYILETGPRWLAMTGKTPEETLGHGWFNALHPDDVAPTCALWTQALQSGVPLDVRYRLRQVDGSYRWFRSRAGARRDDQGAILKWYGLLEDIDEQVRSQAALQDTERRLQAVLNNASVAFFLIDERELCVYMNAAAEALTGFTMNEMRNRHLHDMIHHTHEDGTPFPVEECRLHNPLPLIGSLRGEEVYITKDGRFVPVAYTISPIRDEALHPLGKIVEFQDISTRRAAALELEQAQQKLMRSSRLTAVGAMASTLAHELNQPLTAVTNFLTVSKMQLQSGNYIDAAIDSLDLAIDQTLRAGSIIRRIRSFTMTGELELSSEDLADLIDQERQILASRFGDRGIAVDIDLADASRGVHVDAVQIRQVIGNLLRNAAEAVVATPDPRIRIRSRVDEDFSCLTIEDNGPGLSGDNLEQPFQLFATEKPEGLGLGLPICRTIMEAHGGKIWAEHSPLGGLAFILAMPLSLR